MVQDGLGQIQFFVMLNDVGVEIYDVFKKWDFGDIVVVCGVLFCINKGELLVQCKELCLLLKVLWLLLDKFYGLFDQEMCYCQCYVDLIVMLEMCDMFCVCMKMIVLICKFMDNVDFMEVEMLMLYLILGGVVVKLFVMYYNVFDMQMFLCIVLELYLKCLIVGGFE